MGADGEVTFGAPVAMPGAVSLSLDPNGEPSNFYADGYAYYTISNNMGYEGDLELAMVPESFRTDVLKEALDTNQVLVENANAETENFALLFEFDEDVKKIRHVLYHCSAARSNIESQTNEEEIDVQTETLAITASPPANGYVKAQTGTLLRRRFIRTGIKMFICRRKIMAVRIRLLRLMFRQITAWCGLVLRRMWFLRVMVKIRLRRALV